MRLTVTLLFALGLLLPVSMARAEVTPPPAPAPAISLAQAVEALLVNSTEVKLAGIEAEAARGTLLVAGEPFDASLATSVTGSQDQSYSERPEGATEVRQVELASGLSKRLRAGLVVAPEVTTSRTVIAGDPSRSIAQASARLRVLLPLLRDRGGVLTEGPEETARRFHAASLLEARHAAALGVLRAASAYWDYLAAHRRLEVMVASEGRAERTAQETGSLVKADERTRTDRIQAEGHLAASRASRIGAEQEAIDAWERLATAVGVVREDVSTLPPAQTDFPAPGQEPSAESLQRWLQAAATLRDDLRATHWRLEGASVGERAARTELLPRLDLEVSGGYKGLERDREWSRFFAPLHSDVPGLDARAQLRFELPLIRSGARGRVTQAQAARERQQVLRAHVERAIRNGVAASFETVRRSQLALRQSEEAVRLLAQTVDNERQKFRLGFSTLFAVIQAEEQLTSALLGKIAGQRSFAVALARLRYETGTVLAPASGGEPHSSGQAVAAALLLLP